MSLSKKHLALVQKAGQSTHDACSSIAALVQDQASGVVATIASHPLGPESERALVNFKSLSELSQSLLDVEMKMREIHASALELTNPALDVIALPTPKAKKLTNTAAVDAVIKPPRALKPRQQKKNKKKAAALKNTLLTPNDSRLLEYLKASLTADSWTKLTGTAISAGSGLPLGSVGVSLKKILAQGMILADKRSEYKLPSEASAAQS